MKLEVKHVRMAFGQKRVLNDVTMTGQSGQLIGLLGPNGVGKSTLIKLLVTQQKPTGGEILLDGKSIISHPEIMQRKLGYLPQRVPFIPNLTVGEYLEYIAAIKGLPVATADKRIRDLLNRVHLEGSNPLKLQRYSGGMIQRVGLAAMLLDDPDIVIADEPTTGLDPAERINLRNMLASLSKSKLVIVSTHIVSDLEAVANYLILLNAGHVLYQGTPTRLLATANRVVWESPYQPVADADDDLLVQDASGIKQRQICLTRPNLAAVPVSATLEEAYLGVLKGVIK